MSLYRAELLRVLDGDTIDVSVDLRHGLIRSPVRVRVAGIAAPEIRGAQRPLGLKSKDYAINRLGCHPIAIVDYGGVDDEDAFGRWLCAVRFGETFQHDLAAEMLRSGYAILYADRRGYNWPAPEQWPLTETEGDS